MTRREVVEVVEAMVAATMTTMMNS